MADRPDFERIFDALPGAHMVLDSELRYVAANASYLKATGARLEDLVGVPILEVFSNDPADPNNASARMLIASFRRVLETGEVDHLAHIPYRVYADPESRELTDERIWSATHVPILDAEGQVAWIIQHTTDVTAVEHAAASGVLARAEAIQRRNVDLDSQLADLGRLFAQAPGFLCFFRGPEFVYELTNEAYLSLIGEQEVIGKRLVDVLPELEAQGYLQLLRSVFESGEPWSANGEVVQLQEEDGPREIVIDFVLQPVRNTDGTIDGILVQGQDVTSQREAQRAAEAFASELESQSRAVTQALDAAQRRIEELEGST